MLGKLMQTRSEIGMDLSSKSILSGRIGYEDDEMWKEADQKLQSRKKYYIGVAHQSVNEHRIASHSYCCGA